MTWRVADSRPNHDGGKPEHNNDHRDQVIVEALTSFHSALAEVARTVRGDRGVLLAGAVTRELRNGQSGTVTSSPGRLLGYSFRETTGLGDVVLRFRDGTDASGDLRLVATVKAGTDRTLPVTPGGIGYVYGIFVEVIPANGGAVEGVVHLAGSA